MTTTLWKEIEALDTEERMELVEKIQGTLAKDDFVLSDEQKTELRRRMDEMKNDSTPDVSWDEVKRSILAGE